MKKETKEISVPKRSGDMNQRISLGWAHMEVIRLVMGTKGVTANKFIMKLTAIEELKMFLPRFASFESKENKKESTYMSYTFTCKLILHTKYTALCVWLNYLILPTYTFKLFLQ